MLRIARELMRWGASPAAGVAAGAIRHPHETMIVDELGTLTFSEVHSRSNRLARALAKQGVREGDGVALMARNHRGFVEAVLAISKLGANALFMNTMFAGPQLVGVVEREDPKALIYDEEFADLLSGIDVELRRFVAWDQEGGTEDESLESLIDAEPDDSDLEAPEASSKFVVLTSGTTGTPKGAQRGQPDTLGPIAALLSVIPLKARETTMIAAPLFHSWGFAHFSIGLSLSSTYVLRRKFDPEGTLEAVADSRATALIVVPVMMQRILELPRGDDRQVRPLLAQGHLRVGLGAARPAGDEMDGRHRREPLQPLRLDRGGVGDDRQPSRPARRAGDCGADPARHPLEDRRR